MSKAERAFLILLIIVIILIVIFFGTEIVAFLKQLFTDFTTSPGDK